MVCIISGKYAGRRIPVCPSFTHRPTTGKLREAMFSALNSRITIQDSTVLDLFCGTGAFSFESISRGASKAYLVDRNKTYLNHIKEVAEKIGINEFEFLCSDVMRLPKSPVKCDMVFMDPPFSAGHLVSKTLKMLYKSDWIHKDTLVVIECSIKEKLKDEVLKFYELIRQRSYGTALCYMLTPSEEFIKKESQ